MQSIAKEQWWKEPNDSHHSTTLNQKTEKPLYILQYCLCWIMEASWLLMLLPLPLNIWTLILVKPVD